MSKILSIRIAFLTAFFTLSVTVLPQDINKISRQYITENGIQILEDFKALLSIPNVAFDLPNINKNANYIVNELEKRGVETKLLRMVGTPPIVYGYYPVKKAKQTIAFYVHYDGQPVDKTKWTNDPWKPTYYSEALFNGGSRMDFPTHMHEVIEEHRIYARSAGDDKAPIITILSALDMIQSNKLKISSNLVFSLKDKKKQALNNSTNT